MVKDKKEEKAKILVASNRKARMRYEILEVLEAGLSLKGPEVKSLREGRVSFEGSFARVDGREAFLHNLHIPPYAQNTLETLDPVRTRRLLLKRREIDKLSSKLRTKGLTLVPLEVYFLRGWAKVSLGLGKGKKGPDRREDLRKRDVEREMGRSFRGKFKA
ncbi:MAG TPA: SsrA-binding protein [Elusimicrobia bacterium]|nr:SsrA-binding protein [Elusimicrobiota bacterium]